MIRITLSLCLILAISVCASSVAWGILSPMWWEGGALEIDQADLVVVGTLHGVRATAGGDSPRWAGQVTVEHVLVGDAEPGDTLEFSWTHRPKPVPGVHVVFEEHELIRAVWVLNWSTDSSVVAPGSARVVDLSDRTAIYRFLGSSKYNELPPGPGRARVLPVLKYLRQVVAELNAAAEE